jgi:hypothetical protein
MRRNHLQIDPHFLERIARARESLCAGRGVKLSNGIYAACSSRTRRAVIFTT